MRPGLYLCMLFHKKAISQPIYSDRVTVQWFFILVTMAFDACNLRMYFEAYMFF
jgi:hypothetical protein